MVVWGTEMALFLALFLTNFDVFNVLCAEEHAYDERTCPDNFCWSKVYFSDIGSAIKMKNHIFLTEATKTVLHEEGVKTSVLGSRENQS